MYKGAYFHASCSMLSDKHTSLDRMYAYRSTRGVDLIIYRQKKQKKLRRIDLGEKHAEMDNLLSVFLAVVVQGQVDPAHKDTLVLYHQTQPQFQSLGLKNQDTGDLGGDR